MSLPSPEQLTELAGLIKDRAPKSGFGTTLGRMAGKGIDKGAPIALSSGVGKGMQALGVQSGLHIGVTLGGISSAVSAWTTMALVAVQASKVMSLYDILDDAKVGSGGPTRYTCRCKQCEKNIKYIIDKKERNVVVAGLSVATLGLASVAKMAHSIGKSVFASSTARPKQLVSEGIVASAQGGCTTAMATVFLLSGSWKQGYRDKDTMVTAVKTLIEENGWKRLKGNW